MWCGSDLQKIVFHVTLWKEYGFNVDMSKNSVVLDTAYICGTFVMYSLHPPTLNLKEN